MQDYDEVVIPPAKPTPPRLNEMLIRISELDPLVRGSFLVGPTLTTVYYA